LLTAAAYPSANTAFPAEDAALVLALRLLIARAANKDSLDWWDDESLTSQGAFLLERIFPVAPSTAARSLALRATLLRHQAALAPEPQALHLFRLDADNQDGLALRWASPAPLPVPEEPIGAMEALQSRLVELMGEPKPYKRLRQGRNQGLLIEIPALPPGISAIRHRAETLAWAYLEGAHGQPVFPFLLE
jgi:hypothetical protein